MTSVSVIVRAKDEAASIGRVLDLVRDQDGPPAEVIVVDSGSRDETREIARARGARVIEIPAESFTFGGALNTGCAEARGELLVALSAHAFPRDRGWLGRLLEPFADPQVACAAGDRYGPDGEPLARRVVQDAALLHANPYWGYTSSAGAFRAELWRAHPFRTDLPGTEDKAWAHHWIDRGHVCVMDPSFAVDHDHLHDSLREQFVRARREWRGFAIYLDVPCRGPLGVVREWWSEQDGYRSALRARLSPHRAARLLGMYAGLRR
jgi:glycosyltransferase involved in cell wall biosynthesis